MLRVASVRPFEICLRTVLPCTRVPPRVSFTRLEQVHELLELRGSPRGMASAVGCMGFSLGPVDFLSTVQPVVVSWALQSVYARFVDGVRVAKRSHKHVIALLNIASTGWLVLHFHIFNQGE
jgi:hypothetical protein